MVATVDQIQSSLQSVTTPLSPHSAGFNYIVTVSKIGDVVGLF